MRRVPIVFLSVLVVLAGFALTAAPASASTTVSVTPSTGLHEGDQVAVTATGFTPSAALAIVECTSSFASQDDCDLSSAGFAQADQTGSVGPTPFTVYRQIFPTTDPTGFDCAPSNCVLVVANVNNLSEFAMAALTFDTSGPLPPPLQITATVDPTGTFDHAGNITITGTVTCNIPAEVELDVGASQQIGRLFINAQGSTTLSCNGPTNYSILAGATDGVFRGGKAMLKLFINSFSGRPPVFSVVGPVTIQLHGGPK